MRVVCAVLVLAFLAATGGSALAADMSGDGMRSLRYGAPRHETRLRIVEQVPYCGDCQNPIGAAHSGTPRLRYYGWPTWERGCAYGNCYGLYFSGDSCYFKEASLRTARGRWVTGLREFCD